MEAGAVCGDTLARSDIRQQHTPSFVIINAIIIITIVNVIIFATFIIIMITIIERDRVVDGRLFKSSWSSCKSLFKAVCQQLGRLSIKNCRTDSQLS